MYLNLLLMLLALALSPHLVARLRNVRHSPLLLPMVFMIGWTFLAAVVGTWPWTPVPVCSISCGWACCW